MENRISYSLLRYNVLVVEDVKQSDVITLTWVTPLLSMSIPHYPLKI